MDRRGPRIVIESGVVLVALGLFLAPFIASAWHLYLTLGVAVGAGANLMSFTVHSQFLPNWFVRRRALAISIAFSGVGAGAITLLPWLQTIIARDGWRASCWTMGLIVLLVLGPLNLLVRRGPQSLGLLPDGERHGRGRRRRQTSPLQHRGRRLGGHRLDPGAAPCGRRASGGSRSASSAPCSPGMPCRSTRPST